LTDRRTSSWVHRCFEFLSHKWSSQTIHTLSLINYSTRNSNRPWTAQPSKLVAGHCFQSSSFAIGLNSCFHRKLNVKICNEHSPSSAPLLKAYLPDTNLSAASGRQSFQLSASSLLVGVAIHTHLHR
jgi:hypothetical protein